MHRGSELIFSPFIPGGTSSIRQEYLISQLCALLGCSPGVGSGTRVRALGWDRLEGCWLSLGSATVLLNSGECGGQYWARHCTHLPLMIQRYGVLLTLGPV